MFKITYSYVLYFCNTWYLSELGNEKYGTSLIYRRIFLSCLSVIVHGWSPTPVPPGTVSRLAVAVPLQSACGTACGAPFLRRSPRDSELSVL
jgi:hypothetical protein